MKIALLSDTHVPTLLPELPSQLIDRLRAVDLILHAGDLVCLGVLESLKAVAETVAVHSSVDEADVVDLLPRKRILRLPDTSLGLIHGDRARDIERQYKRPEYDYDSPPVEAFYEYLASELPDARIIVFGHFHVPVVMYWRNRLLVNPGSVAPYKDRQSFGMLTPSPAGAEVEIIEL